MDSFIKDKLNNYYDIDVINRISNGYNCKRYTTLRVNNLKCNKDYVLDILNKNNILYEDVSFYDNALIIKNVNEDVIKNEDIFKDGYIYLQSLSSMIPPFYLDINNNEQILDMCAAPGGKTSLIAALSNNNVMITAIEKNKIRYDRLCHNLDLLGVKKCTVLNIDALFINEYMSFDKILLDVPCSGSGTINGNDSIDPKLFNNLLNIQEKLLRKALSVLKSGGTLVYSTCSIFKEENEYQIEKILKDYKVEVLPIDDKFDLPKLDSKIGITICPNEYYEGFYICKLKKL